MACRHIDSMFIYRKSLSKLSVQNQANPAARTDAVVAEAAVGLHIDAGGVLLVEGISGNDIELVISVWCNHTDAEIS